MQVARQHVVGVLRRAGPWGEAEGAAASLPESREREEMAERCAAQGITRDRLGSLLGGSP
jgi:hypothetical protein